MAYSPFLFRSFLFGGYKNICESVTRLKGANVLGSMVCIKYTLTKCTHWDEKENSLFMDIFLRNAKCLW